MAGVPVLEISGLVLALLAATATIYGFFLRFQGKLESYQRDNMAQLKTIASNQRQIIELVGHLQEKSTKDHDDMAKMMHKNTEMIISEHRALLSSVTEAFTRVVDPLSKISEALVAINAKIDAHVMSDSRK